MCNLLYVKLIWYSNSPEIYAGLEEGDGVSLSWVYVHSSICETYFLYCIYHRSMLDWRRGWSQSAIEYICIPLYVNLIWCSGFPEIYARFEWRGMELSLPWVYVHSSICETYLV